MFVHECAGGGLASTWRRGWRGADIFSHQLEHDAAATGRLAKSSLDASIPR